MNPNTHSNLNPGLFNGIKHHLSPSYKPLNYVSRYRIFVLTVLLTYSHSNWAQINDLNTIKDVANTAIQSFKKKLDHLKNSDQLKPLLPNTQDISNIPVKNLPIAESNLSNTNTPTTTTTSTTAIQNNVGKMSVLRKLVSAKQIETEANQHYQRILQEAKTQNTLRSDQHEQVIRLRTIAKNMIPLTMRWNSRAVNWQWEINLIDDSKQINAFCMPGGKIVFYTAILEELKLNDDEIAMVMGHEIAHALREHGRERIGKSVITQGALSVGSSLLGLGDTGRAIAGTGANLLSLKFGREDEIEGDLIGMELAARAGYDPRAGISLWKKMSANNKGSAPQWLSTHPSGKNRIAEINKYLPNVLPLYAKTRNMTVEKLPPVNF